MANSLLFFASLLAILLCSGVHGIPSCAIQNVCFAIDESGSLNPTEFDQETDAVVNIANAISAATGSAMVSYSAIGFSGTGDASTVQTPTVDLGVFNQNVNDNVQSSGQTDLGSGLTACFNIINSLPGTKVIVLLTDGQNNEGSFVSAVTDIKAAGVSIVTVGIGSGIDSTTLEEIATKPEFFIGVSDFSMLPQSIQLITDDICAVVSIPTACEEAFAECGLKFKNKDDLQTFNLRNKAKKRFTKLVVDKKSNHPPGKLSSNKVLVRLIRNDGSQKSIGTLKTHPRLQGFHTVSVTRRIRFALKLKNLNPHQLHALSGQCLKVLFKFYGKRKCIVFKIA